ncbi:MAG: DegT/DnrJ/EryC1/StrS family aminotransferase [Bdellovibrionales bacterium]
MEVRFFDLSAFDKKLYPQFMESLSGVIGKSHFIKGLELQNFETEFSKRFQHKNTIGVGNGLDALTISIKALKLPQDSEIIVPANTFAATALAVTQAGHKIRLCEINPKTGNIDPNRLKVCINENTSALIVVHLYGNPANMSEIKKALPSNIKIIEDNAQAVGAKYKNVFTGNLGDISATSFYPTKPLGCYGDGGAISSNNDAIAEYCRSYANYGSRDKYIHEFPGVNSRLDEMQAAILNIKLAHYDEQLNLKAEIYKQYKAGLNSCEHLQLIEPLEDTNSAFHLLLVKSPNRERLKNYLEDSGIQCLIHYPIPLNKQPALRDSLFESDRNMPITESFCDQILSLPFYPGLDENSVHYVCEKIKKFETNHREST